MLDSTAKQGFICTTIQITMTLKWITVAKKQAALQYPGTVLIVCPSLPEYLGSLIMSPDPQFFYA